MSYKKNQNSNLFNWIWSSLSYICWFWINSKKEIYKKLNQLKTSTKTYFLEEEVLEHGLFSKEIVVPVKQKAIYRLKEGGNIINYIGFGCNCIDCINLKMMDIII